MRRWIAQLVWRDAGSDWLLHFELSFNTQHALGGVPERRPFEPKQVAVQKFDDDDYQPVYYVADSVEDAMQRYADWMKDNT